MKSIVPFLILTLLVWSCESLEHPPVEQAEDPVMISMIYPSDSLAFIEKGYLDTALASDYLFRENGTVYFNSGQQEDIKTSIPVNVFEINLSSSTNYMDIWDWFKEGEPELKDSGFVYLFDPLDTIGKLYAYRLWWKAQCGSRLPGFHAKCMGTFGKHQAIAPYMNWNVRTHTECSRGSFYCLDLKKDIGGIFYHQSSDCTDIWPRYVPISKYVCD